VSQASIANTTLERAQSHYQAKAIGIRYVS